MSSDWMLRCATAGAKGAAEALGRVLERTPLAESPGAERFEFAALERKIFPDDESMVAVFADLVGAVRGQAGIAMTRAAAVECVQALIADDDVDVFDARSRSALSELGNIALSAACGEMARRAGGVIMPSVPRLGTSLGEALLLEGTEQEMRNLPVYVAETGLTDASGTLSLRFVWLAF